MGKLHDLVTKVLMSSSVALGITPVAECDNHDPGGSQIPTESQYASMASTNYYHARTKKRQLVLKPTSDQSVMTFADHTSHASHASHASHVSSSGGGAIYVPVPVQTPPSPKPTPQKQEHVLGSRVLYRDCEGADVLELRALLRTKGYDIQIAPLFDSLTELDVRDFQQKAMLTPSGVVDSTTISHLRQSPSGNMADDSKGGLGQSRKDELGARLICKGMSGPDVFELERLLVSKGYTLSPDSLFDDYTEIAVKDFQLAHGIPSDGKVGPLTVYHLRR